jgi:hypothetical protein
MTELFHLIKTLKPGEKRYFTLSTQLVGAKKTNYLQLFEAIDGMQEYDETVLVKKYRKENFVKNLAAHKNYLYELILDVLRNYNEENVEEWKIKKNVYKIKLLASKGLDEACLKLMEKTKTKAWQYEEYSALEDILEIQLYLFGNLRIGKMSNTFFETMQNEKDKLLQIISDYNFVLGSWHRINLLFINQQKETFAAVVAKAKAIVDQLVSLGDKGADYSLKLRNRYLACFELFYNSIGDAEKCYTYNKMLIENRAIIDERMPNFSVDAMAVYFNFMVACFKHQRWNEMETYLHKTKDYPILSIEQEIRRTHNYCYNGMLLYLATNKMEAAAEVVTIFDAARKKHVGRYRIDFLLFTQSLCGFYYFLNGEFEKANQWWREIIDGPKYSVEVRTQASTRLYLMLLHLQQGDWEIFDYAIVNAARYIKSANLFGEREKLFFTACKKIIKVTNRKNELKKLAQAFTEITTPLSEKSVVNSFIIDWVKRKSEE